MKIHHGTSDDGRGSELAVALLGATTARQVADILLDGYPDLRANASVYWSSQWPQALDCHPPGRHSDQTAQVVADVAAIRTGQPLSSRMHLLHHDGDAQIAVLYCPAGCPNPTDAALSAVGVRMGEVLLMQGLQRSVGRLEQAEKLQHSLYAIADMADSSLEMPELLRGLHRIIADLMYAENFYIALYNRERDSLRFPYFVDTVGSPDDPVADEDVPLTQLKGSLTWYLIHDRKPLMGSTQALRQQVSGPLTVLGADSNDWLGVPMLREGEVFGALVVQSYQEGSCYTSAEMSLLAFVAEHILTALERRKGREELERRVDERTAQLADINVELRREVVERERGERLQATLYRIAALAGSDETSDRFYKHVHAGVSELINAENLYIALLSEDGTEVSFPYAIDRETRDWHPRSRARGLTEFVLRTGRPQLVDRDRMQLLVEIGEVDPGMVDTPTLVWLGAPLLGADGPIGVIAVQSYEASTTYDQRDAELLTFVSYQIASTLQRRRAAALLFQANVELEQRVQTRTAELREQITVREQAEMQLQHQVRHDALTGLPNRAYLYDRVERAIARLRRDPKQRFGVLYIDVDRFKVINDSLGHLSGDEVLQEVARRLMRCMREPDIVARLAGDEFAVLLEDVQMPETASRIAQRILKMFESPLTIAGRGLQVSVSVGISIVDERYDTPDQILQDADLALYRAKEAGRNRFVLFDEDMQRSAMNVLDLEQGLRNALVKHQFIPYFQPLVRLDNGSVVGYEALLRWQHPERGLLAPGEFLAVAEDSGLIEAIDWQMFRMALECSRPLTTGGCFITLNVSPRLFQRQNFDTHLLGLVAELDFDPTRLRLEVTEGTLLGDPEAVVAVLQRLRAANIEAALDDFGTGYSSLGHVHRFPLKMIKIDRSFIMPFADDGAPRSSAVIEAILALGNALGVEIVAEGVETEYQRAVLAAMGCVFGQGYLFARPQPIAHWLASVTPRRKPNRNSDRLKQKLVP